LYSSIFFILGIFIASLYVGRISPNGFRRDFPLALLLFSQVYILLNLLIGVGYTIFVGLPLILGFWGANMAYESMANSESKENLTRFSGSFWSLVTYTLYPLIVLTRIVGSMNLVHGNMVGIVLLVSVYSLILPLFVSVFHTKFSDKRFVLNMLWVTFYYALIGYTIGYLSGWSLIEAIFLVVLYVGVLLHLWATFTLKREPEDEESHSGGTSCNG